MIQYSLRCDKDHRFDSWFKSAGAFDALKAAGHVACAVCGSSNVDKAMMAPRVKNADTSEQAAAPLSEPADEREAALKAFKAHVEKNATYVGTSFASEARAIHSGDAPERMIYGETRGDEARKLVEDGIPVAPLPFAPTRKAN